MEAAIKASICRTCCSRSALDDKLALPGISQHLARQLGGPFAGLHEILDNLRREIPAVSPPATNWHFRLHHQQIIEVMRNAPGSTPALQLLRLPQLVFEQLRWSHPCHPHAHRGAAGIVACPPHK